MAWLSPVSDYSSPIKYSEPRGSLGCRGDGLSLSHLYISILKEEDHTASLICNGVSSCGGGMVDGEAPPPSHRQKTEECHLYVAKDTMS
ncbi:hypothetical protein E2C01_038168 [Portunus trituberculatus]|uniref:Uncharacterized protein n=1 Tax=Portunus trituberculatus TaxID=210409 RepID=A0A5B7FG39_PORTR|nr:hypothetical protein [Portunus trituberculatus]